MSLSSWKLVTSGKIMTSECNIVRRANMTPGYINLRISECMNRNYTAFQSDKVSKL